MSRLHEVKQGKYKYNNWLSRAQQNPKLGEKFVKQFQGKSSSIINRGGKSSISNYNKIQFYKNKDPLSSFNNKYNRRKFLQNYQSYEIWMFECLFLILREKSDENKTIFYALHKKTVWSVGCKGGGGIYWKYMILIILY